MDRRQRKTREAILQAFTELLSEKRYAHITVGEIIERANVGRATFYAHFETKDYLMREMCEELFCHIFDAMEKDGHNHKHIFECDAPDSVFLHLLRHLQKNDNHILDLLSGENNEVFLRYFKDGLRKLIESQFSDFESDKTKTLPKDYLINHIASTFVETFRWWLGRGMNEPAEVITEYFLTAIQANRH